MRLAEQWLAVAIKAGGVVAGLVLLGIMLTTVVDVTLRASLNIAFLGVTEVTQLGLVVIAAFGIAYCGLTGGHIALEFGERLVPAPLWRLAQRLVTLASLIIIAGVALYSLEETVSAFRRGAHTNLLQIAEYPFHAVVALGFFAYALVLVLRLVKGAGTNAERGAAE